MSRFTTTQIALFVAEIQDHLKEEEGWLRSAPDRGSFQEGFLRGMQSWERITRYEEDFYYAIGVLDKLLQPIGLAAKIPIKKLSAESWGHIQSVFLEEIGQRRILLGALQREILAIPEDTAREAFSSEVLSDFEDSLERSLQSLLH